jgi:hypothetical protein
MNGERGRAVGLLLALGGSLALLSGCGIVGWKYNYAGHEYNMTKSNSAYHQAAVSDVRARYGDPSVQQDATKLAGACELLQKYAAGAPDPGQFTPARELLDNDAKTACSKAERGKERDEQRAESERREQAREAREAARKHEQDEARTKHDQAIVASRMARDTQMVAACDATEAARAARRRHAAILEQAPGAQVRKECSPRMETQSVRSECKDAAGFTRTCTKAVSTGEVASYVCPKSMDAEVVQLGLYQLQLLDGYPYPEDHAIRTRDRECDDARARVAQSKVGEPAAIAGAQ